MQLSEGRVFQADSAACTKALRHKRTWHVWRKGRKPNPLEEGHTMDRRRQSQRRGGRVSMGEFINQVHGKASFNYIPQNF